MPAGYLEADEDPKACAASEALGETGYTVKICDLLGIYTYEDDPRGNGVVLLYSGEIISGKIKKNHEMLQVKYFLPEEVKALRKAGDGGNRQIEDWINQVNGPQI
jgi:8-oxo-dGTP pyrophosphatase MutT (NUDIX family)